MHFFIFFLFFVSTNFALPVVDNENKKDEFIGQILDEEKFTLLNKKPAMKMRLTKKGMNYLNLKAAEVFNDFVENFVMAERRFSMVNFNASMTLTNTTTKNYVAPTFTYMVIDQTVTWHGVGGHMVMDGFWEMTVQREKTMNTMCTCLLNMCVIRQMVDNNSTTTTTENGNFTLDMKDMDMVVTMVMGMKLGKPTLHLEKCNVMMTTVQTAFKNCTDKTTTCPDDETVMAFWNVTMETTMCAMMTVAVARINAAMQSFDTEMPIGHSPFHIDYTMLAVPKCIPEVACETVHMAEVMCNSTAESTTTVASFLPVPMPPVTLDMDERAMMLMQMSDNMMNSMADLMYRLGMMNATVNNETATSHEMAAMLRTECPSTDICMGTITNEMMTKYPNCTVSLHIQAVKPTLFETTLANGMRMYTQSVITVYYNDEELMSMDVTSRGVITPKVINATIFMNASMTDIKVTPIKSVFGNVDVVQVEKLAELGLLSDQMFVEQMFEKHLAEGIPLPGMNGVTMEPCGMFMQERAMAMCFNMIV